MVQLQVVRVQMSSAHEAYLEASTEERCLALRLHIARLKLHRVNIIAFAAYKLSKVTTEGRNWLHLLSIHWQICSLSLYSIPFPLLVLIYVLHSVCFITLITIKKKYGNEDFN